MKRLNIVVSLITDDNDFQLEQAASAQSAALKLGAGVQIIYSGNDAVQQTQQILAFIQDPAKRPDAILAEPVGTAMAQIAKAAVGAGICLGNHKHRRGLPFESAATRPGASPHRPVGS
jgi:ABC-type sugar transport system substrate-binding protein